MLSAQALISPYQTDQTCVSDVKNWMTQNKRKLNDDKIEALLTVRLNISLTLSPFLFVLALPTFRSRPVLTYLVS